MEKDSLKSLIINPLLLKKLIVNWVEEDVPNFDYSASILINEDDIAGIFIKQSGVLAGIPFVNAIFKELNCTIEWFYEEGTYIESHSKVANVCGNSRNILLGERIALNCISRASGIATLAFRLKTIAKYVKWNGEIAGTRKTTPGFRMVEKYALLIGGASTHRYNLSSMVMLKDNHILAAGNISKAVKSVQQITGSTLKIEVECRGLSEALEAAEAGSDIIMLDNFDPQVLHSTAKMIKSQYPKVIIEASGGISESNITNYMGPDINIISTGKLTQGYECIDFSMKLLREHHDPHNPIVKSL